MPSLSTKIAVNRTALRFCPEWLGQGYAMENLADHLFHRFEELGAISDLEEAIALQRNTLALRPQGHPFRARALAYTSEYLRVRFQQLGVMSDLDEALALGRSAVELHPRGQGDRAFSLAVTACSLHARFDQLGAMSDLEEAISFERKALELRSPGQRYRDFSLCNLAIYLHTRFNQLGSLSDLDEALSFQREALELRPPGHPQRASSLCNIASYLYIHFVQLGTLSDLEEAIALERKALELRPPGHPQRARSLGNISNYLYTRFTQLGTLPDLEEAISLHRHALELCPPGHPERAASLGNIASYLCVRFSQLGTLSDLEEALSLQRDALEFRPPGHPQRSYSLGNIAGCLYVRFTQLGTLSDLEGALSFERDALELRPPGHPHRGRSLSSIARYLYARFVQLQTLSDLEEALSLERSALELHPPGHADRAFSLASLASSLCARFNKLGALSDLEEALSLERNALELRPSGHPQRVNSLSSIADYLYLRFTRLETLRDLEEALSFHRNALELRPHGNPDRAFSLGALARCLHARSIRSPTHNNDDLHEMFDLYSQLSDASHSVSSADLECAKVWIGVAEEFKHNTTVSAYQTFLHLTVQYLAILPSLPQHLALLKRLIASVAVDAFSACVRSDNLAGAIELLEQGRGVFWSQLTRLRSPLDEVVASGDRGNKLAEKFTQLASLLRNVFDVPPTAAMSQNDRACRLNVQLQDTVAAIRKLPGLSHFLHPPLFSDLQVAAAGGPVIIVNASKHTCDALVLLADKHPIHISLHITKARVSQLSSELRALTLRARFNDMTKEYVILLRELWDDVVGPAVKVLQESCSPRSRIWWCPTAEFSLLPLHAAGPYRKGQQNFSDLYISSYTPTLTALIRARQKMQLDSPTEQQRFLIVGQAQTPGQNELASVNVELSTISERVGSVATVTCVQDQDASIGKVAGELDKNHFVHFACHGIPDRKHPFESGFALGDGLLKVENIMRYDLRDAKFAYLSACHTTVGDEESPDEVIHLAAAMEFAGFRSVIGTMWAVDDANTKEITSRFYGHMVDGNGRLDHTRAALALHKTMRSFRPSDIPFDQRILYIHIGA